MISRCAGDSSARHDAQDLVTLLLLHRDFRVVGRIFDEFRDFVVELLVRAAAQAGQRLVAGDREQPGRHLAAALEPLGLPPHVDEDLAHHVFGGGFVAQEAQREPIDLHVVAAVQHLQRLLVAGGDGFDQRHVGIVLGGPLGAPFAEVTATA